MRSETYFTQEKGNFWMICKGPVPQPQKGHEKMVLKIDFFGENALVECLCVFVGWGGGH